MSTETHPKTSETTSSAHDAVIGPAQHSAQLLTVTALLTAIGTDAEILPWDMIQKVVELMGAA